MKEAKKIKKSRSNGRKKCNKILIVIFLIIFVLLISIICIYAIMADRNDIESDTPVKIKDNMENYDYYLTENATSYYEQLYNELKNVLNEETINEQSFAEVISKLFITDVFTLDNKISSNDIGGLQFIYSDFKEDFINIVKTTLYSTVESNIYGDRKQELPIVSNVEIVSINSGEFKYNDTKYPSYEVAASISYQVDLGYPNEYKVVLIKNDKYWQVVSGK